MLNESNFKKTVLITGASRGIGEATARKFAENNYNVIINYQNSADKAIKLEKELNELGYNALAIKCDVSKYEDVEKMIAHVLKNYKKIDVLVNNAGIAQQKLFTDITSEEWQKMFNVNVTSVFNCCKAVLPQMISNKAGKIINVSSMWGLVGASCEVHYSASKAAVIGFTKALAKEVGLSNIRVNCVAPGVIKTDMMSGFDEDTLQELKDETPLAVLGKPIDIANTIYFLASEQADFITGQVISANGGFVI